MIEVPPTSAYTDHARDLSPDEYANLKASIEAVGILKPVLITEDGELLDGKHRRRIADELGIDCPARIVDPTDESEALRMAIDANTTGRLMTREERRGLVAKMRANGMSIRETADALGVPKSTVHDDSQHVQPSESGQVNGEPSPRERVETVLAEKPDATVREVATEAGVAVGTVHAAKHAPSREEREAEELERERQRALQRRCGQLEDLVRGWLMVREWDEPRMEVVDLLSTDQDREMFFELWSRIHD